MQLPFTKEQFFDLFAAYNAALWPVLIGLWIASVMVSGLLLVSRRPINRLISALLAAHWAWSALAYHIAFFTRINPAAWVFAALFVTQAALLAWHGIARQCLEFSAGRSTQVVIGYGLVAYGLLYPVLALVGGHAYPRVPTFGVPCPTTIVTAGFLTLLRGRVPPTLAIIPMAWALIGGSGAFLFGVPADVGLLVAGAVLAYRTWSTSAAAPA